MRVSRKKRKLESQISFLKPQDASTKACGQPGCAPPCDPSQVLPGPKTCFPERTFGSRSPLQVTPTHPSGLGQGHGVWQNLC